MRRWVKVHVVEGVPGRLMDIETACHCINNTSTLK